MQNTQFAPCEAQMHTAAVETRTYDTSALHVPTLRQIGALLRAMHFSYIPAKVWKPARQVTLAVLSSVVDLVYHLLAQSEPS